MKEKIISLLIECDEKNEMVLSDKSMSPSSSIEEIAEYIGDYFKNTENKAMNMNN